MARAQLLLLVPACLPCRWALLQPPPVFLCPPRPAPQDAKALQAQSRDLRAALALSKREATALASQLERASALLAEARQEAADAQAAAAAAAARIQLLEKSWEAALWRERQ